MAKRQLCLYVDDDLISIAKSRGLKLSQMFNNMLQSAIDMPIEQTTMSVQNLEQQEAKLLAEINKIKVLKEHAKEEHEKYGELSFEVD